MKTPEFIPVSVSWIEKHVNNSYNSCIQVNEYKLVRMIFSVLLFFGAWIFINSSVFLYETHVGLSTLLPMSMSEKSWAESFH